MDQTSRYAVLRRWVRSGVLPLVVIPVLLSWPTTYLPPRVSLPVNIFIVVGALVVSLWWTAVWQRREIATRRRQVLESRRPSPKTHVAGLVVTASIPKDDPKPLQAVKHWDELNDHPVW